MSRVTKSRWRIAARETIDQAVKEAQEQHLDGPATLKHISAAWSGPREGWPYQMWLKERRITIEQLQLPTFHPRPVNQCRFCQGEGCLACATPIQGGNLPACYYDGGPRDELTATP